MSKIIFILFLFNNLSSASNYLIKEFSFEDLIIEKKDNFSIILLPNCELTDEIGKPRLPVFSEIIPLEGKRLSKIDIEKIEVETLKEDFLISPSQKQYPLSFLPEKIDFVLPDEKVYSSKEPYPGKIFEFVGITKGREEEFALFLIYPVQYIPVEKKIIFYKKIKLKLELEGEDFKPFEPARNIEYLCLTEPPLDTVFERLVNWKRKKGIPSVIRTVSWVSARYPGRDLPEKIRNYLKTLPDSGVKWLLLGGDVNIIPCRFAYAMTCSAGFHPREDKLPCDLYYSDLDGDWNFDGDTIFGEVEDSIDLYPDLIVGRAPVNTITEAQAFVNKVLTYEKNPLPSYLSNVLFFAEVLWQNPYTDGGVHKDKMERESFSSDLRITKLYERLGNLSRSAVMAEIRNGKNLLNHDGHGWIDVMSTGGTYLRNRDMDTITNLQKYGVLYSIGCWTTAFDFDCIAEHYVKNPAGGGIAFIGNSSYGWGSPGNPGFGYSDKFDNRFFFELLKNKRSLGEALAYSKIYYLPFSRQKNVYRWHQYQVNLLGDPEINVWSKEPCSLDVFSPNEIPRGEERILINVSYQGKPVKNALVCLSKDNESYSRGYTDEKGEIFLKTVAHTQTNFSLTVTAPNFYPLEREIPVASGGYVNFLGFLINDSLGNNDQIINPNETIFLSPILKNCGNEPANNINIYLSSSDTFLKIIDSFYYLSSLLPNESIVIERGFKLAILNGRNGYCCYLNLSINGERIFKTSILICEPILSVYYSQIKDKPVLPGEVKKINISLYNNGFGIGHNSWAFLSSLDPYIQVLSPESLFYGEIDPKSIKEITDTFLISILPSCPSSHLASLQLNIHCQNYLFIDTFLILIGWTGFWDDMENGDSLWQTGGISNLWHLSTRRAHSGNSSFYCGNEASGKYNNNMDAFLQTIPFIVEENPYLKFWRWFKVPNYGVDGIYVIIIRHNNQETLDFIGTGGALGKSKVIEGDWCEEFYDLSFLNIGETIQVRISFKSDDDGQVSEGFYIDDFLVSRLPPKPPVFKKEEQISQEETAIFPTLITKGIRIKIKEKNGELMIFDKKGSLIRRFKIPKNGIIFWDKKNEKGNFVSQGIYFLFFKGASGKFKFIKKYILLK